MTKEYEVPKGRRIIADFDENGITKVTKQALDSLIGELNYYADKVCDIEQIRAEIEQIQGNEYEVSDMQGNRYKYETIEKAEVLQIIDKYTKGEDDAGK